MHQPVTTPRAPLPVLRAAMFAVVGTVLGASAHHLLGEGPVPWARGGAAAAVLFGLGLAGTRRPRRLVTVAVCSVVAQCGLHLWLTLTPRTRHTPATAALHARHHGGQVHDVHVAWHERLHGSMAMTVAHALVALLVAVLLHRADLACWTLAHGVTAVLEALRARLASARPAAVGRLSAAEALGRPVVLPAGGGGLRAVGPVLAHAVVRRGPPATRTALVN
ncbi:hypothetical protein [Streptomyces aurantiogriseus]|uniref:Uncharacterized protein n=1 Tax=Streptomyces aurantiogriseus TaxID=66870 RepID=A0A918FJ76_9ACTN|nr:hypothetical protein [Streptomyces aurantiogriseus]GGR42320.1 hypothetical protein GCM10010251_69170 [Streptomyces aurantiogriseus]